MVESQICMVVPVFNEASRFNEKYWTTVTNSRDIAFLFVNDGSSDGTKEILNSLSAHSAIRCLHLDENVGKANAVRIGLEELLSSNASVLQFVGFIDADEAIPCDEFIRFIDESQEILLSNLDIHAVWASRIALAGHEISRRKYRHFLGRCVSTFLAAGEENFPYDTQCGLKIFVASNDLKRSLSERFQSRWLMEIELLARMNEWHEFNLVEFPIRYWRDVPGSKITLMKSLSILVEIIKVKFLLIQSRRAS